MDASRFADHVRRYHTHTMAAQVTAAIGNGIIGEAQALPLIEILNAACPQHYRFALVSGEVVQVTKED